jgi:hypothetical protein
MRVAKNPEIQLDTTIDFTALTDQFEAWPKTNDFGHPTTVKKPAITPGTPISSLTMPGSPALWAGRNGIPVRGFGGQIPPR